MTAVVVGLPPGTVIDGLKVVKVLGDGGFAIVHLVEKNGKLYALKLARHRETSGDEKQTHARTLRELAILLMLVEHPNFVHPCGYGYWPDKASGNVYLVLDYVEGWTLGEWKERKHPTFHEILRVFVKIAAALAYMHSRGVLHRDLKWANVLISKSDGEPIIIDFSCASHALAEDLTDGGLHPGTDRFRAPEQFTFLREHKDEHRARYAFKVSDEIFAFGAMLYELLTDPRPTEERPRIALNSNRHTPPPAKELNPRVPQALSDLVESLLARDPAKRPVDTEALRREVAELASVTSEEYGVTAHLPSEQLQPAPSGKGKGEPAAREPEHERPKAALLALVSARISSRKMLAVGGLLAASILALWLWPGEVLMPAPSSAPSVAVAPAPSTVGPMVPLGSAFAMSMPTPPRAVDIGPAATADTNKEGPTVTTQKPEAPKQSRTPRGQKPLTPPPSLSVCKALLPAAAIAAGCTGVQVRPEPFECPERVQRIMTEQLGWELGDGFIIALDDRWDESAEPILHPGEVVGLVQDVGQRRALLKKAPAGTQFRGRLYVDPEGGKEKGEPAQVIVKYDRVKLPNQEELPVCTVARSVKVYTLEKDGGAKAANSGQARVRSSYP